MINSENAIEVRNVTKYFKCYEDRANKLRERIVHFGRNKYEKRLVLDNISFDVKKGEAIGLIGKNGCGKSTTLKMLTKILKPNSGTIEMAGRVSSLIELGAGFHPDLTGRENIYINASIFGIKAKEVDRRLDDIIRFSELEEYIDNPVRTYSSGMYMRLAFAVAINVEADILLIDEILAVGDQAFQTKCFNKLKSLKDDGVTIVLVSHSIDQVQKICDRAVWINEGHIKEDGPVRIVCKDYLDALEERRQERAKIEAEAQQAEIEKVDIEALSRKEAEKMKKTQKNLSCRDVSSQALPNARRDGEQEIFFSKILINEGVENLKIHEGEKVDISINCEAEVHEKGKVSICIYRSDRVMCFGTSSYKFFDEYMYFDNGVNLKFSFENRLLPGKYTIDFIIENEDGERKDALLDLLGFEVISDESNNTMVGVMSMDNSWIKG